MGHLSNRFSIYILIGRLVTMGASFAMPLILVRCMSQADYGVFSQFFTLYTAVYAIMALGLHSSLFYYYPSAKQIEREKLVSNTFLILIALGVIGSAIMYCPPIANAIFGDSELGQYKEWILLSIAFATPMNIVSPLNTVRADKWGAMIIPGFVAILRIITVVSCVLVFDDMNSLFKWLFIFQVFILVVIGLYTTKGIRLRLDFSLLKQQLSYSLPFGFAVALQLFSNYFDKFVCIKFLTPTDYAIYGIAFLSIPGVTQVYDSLCQVNIVNMSKSYRDGNVDEIAPQYRNFVIKSLSFSTPLILSVSVFAEEIMSFLYTDSYAASAPYFRLYSLTFLTSMFGAGTVLRSMGRTKQSLGAFIITCVIGLPATYLLIKNFGTNGAIIGALVNMVLPRLIQMVMESRALGISISVFLPWNQIGRIIVGGVVLLLPMIIIKNLFSLHIFIVIILSALYIVCTYCFYIKKGIFIIEAEDIIRFLRKNHLIK